VLVINIETTSLIRTWNKKELKGSKKKVEKNVNLNLTTSRAADLI
jgi:hypothetical protein